jgi:hypothetical protein
MRLPGRSPKGNAVGAEQTNIPDPRATEPLRALPREQENWLTPRNAPYEFSYEKRTFHYRVTEEVKSRKASGGLLEEMISSRKPEARQSQHMLSDVLVIVLVIVIVIVIAPVRREKLLLRLERKWIV